MSKEINLTFNELGILVDYEVDEIRQGDVGVVVSAYFTGKNNANYLARINFTRNDEKQMTNLSMIPSATESHTYTKKLDSAWYFEKMEKQLSLSF